MASERAPARDAGVAERAVVLFRAPGPLEEDSAELGAELVGETAA